MKRKCVRAGCERRAVCSVGTVWWYCAEHYDEIKAWKPKTFIIASDIPAGEIMALRAHIDEAISDPDYSVLVSYEVDWE